MSPTELSGYVAAGCLVLDRADPRLPDELWSFLAPSHWHHLGPFDYVDLLCGAGGPAGHRTAPDAPQNGSSLVLYLDPSIQSRLLCPSGCLAAYAGLLRGKWVHMSLGQSTDGAELAVVRVYLLPDDVDNRRIPRGDPSLRKARLSLLAQLDFSPNTWQGDVRAPRSASPALPERHERASKTNDGEPQSLLQLFNSIPSPDPRPQEIHDLDARDAALGLMSSDVPGLVTTLYSYQRRSAALMLQRESQRRQILDPRLVKVADQTGMPWYYDPVTGTSRREPRYYDGPCGGILAEEMGSGKTLICLALILATRHIPSAVPDHLRTDAPGTRRRVGSLADMAAACITRHSVPWKTVFGALEPEGVEYTRCIDAIRRNPGVYQLQPAVRRRHSRLASIPSTPAKVYLSHCSLVIVPPNLVQQWKQEIAKHTLGLSTFVVEKKRELPSAEELLEYDIVLFSLTRFERLFEDLAPDSNGGQVFRNPLAQIRFKRCIVDEGHKLGNATLHRKSNVHLIIDHLQVASKWIVTGTPSKGLFGVDDIPSSDPESGKYRSPRRHADSSPDLESDDLRRIGSIATLYLQMRPWANQWTEPGDTPADWAVYVMQPKHSARSTGRAECLRTTLESLIIRHRLSEIGDLLPSVDEKVVYLDGSYQDQLVLNLFSMMIIFNAVQSQRTDQDYFFHPRQRKALLELVSNLRQASFFGGSFFSPAEIQKSVNTAEEFLREGKVPISTDDESLLRDAIALGRVAIRNRIKECANLFREVPLYVQNFPWGAGREWSLDLKGDDDPVCTDSRMILALQRLVHPLVDAPTSLQIMYDSGRFAARGREERLKGIEDQDPNAGGEPTAQRKNQQKALAGNTQLGQDNSSPSKRRSTILSKGPLKAGEPLAAVDDNTETGIAEPLARTQLISTASAKLSYLIDQIVKYQDTEQIIVFYENDNVAYYLAGVLEILQIQHLIYAKGLTPERRAQYVVTFNHNPKFRVLLMDITQAAFGLDMRSASRVYFISPVLNPQVEAQAVARARRISSTSNGTGHGNQEQRGPVSVETLVLRGSVEEVIVRRRREMTRAEQWKCRSILDDRPIYEWILNARILPLPLPTAAPASGGDGGGGEDIPGPAQMAPLRSPQFIFGRGFGRELSHPDQDLVTVNGSPVGKKNGGVGVVGQPPVAAKRPLTPGSGSVTPLAGGCGSLVVDGGPARAKRPRVRFADSGDETGD